MKNMFAYLYQLPQNLLGLLLIKMLKAEKRILNTNDNSIEWYYFKKRKLLTAVSLGKYILSPYENDKTILHEYGHSKQSLFLGFLYLLIIGLPSAAGNLLSRKIKWVKTNYYKLPWEAWANKLGRVER